MPAHSAVTAVLGPTNTGKTHLAVERMLAHGSGMIGLPLRLLAREVYDRITSKVGKAHAALITGEEKILPAKPRYWISTVEAMPPDVSVPFLAIDECQLCADFERGHVFTDRILNRRGNEETMLLGASTMQGILKDLLPRVQFVSRPRFSKLTYTGAKKISRLPRRSAIVAFSAEQVYAVAELIRRQNGGAAVVLGGLSPRTRNAQVELFQSGEVDYIVATDAIGMGLNMAVDHVAFAARRKFDGFQFRDLSLAELGQIAGRAGRHLNDGTFGVTGEASPFDEDMVERLENHRFDPVRVLQWRNAALDFRSLDTLQRSLLRLPERKGLTRAQAGADVIALETLARDEDIASRADRPERIELLWSVCQIPDYRNISPAEHAHLISRTFRDLTSARGYIDEDWFSRQLDLCDRIDGDLDTLSNRLSHVRTWTFVANRANWLHAPIYWQQRSHDIEDRLSDALHERLTQRFIDRRTSLLMRRLAQRDELMATVEEDGAIWVEGEYAGHIRGLNFIPDGEQASQEQRMLKQAALQKVSAELQARAAAAVTTADTDLKLSRSGEIIWNDAAIGQLEAGDNLLQPRIRILATDLLQSQARVDVQNRLQKFVTRHIEARLEPLIKLQEAETLQGLVRGLAFRLIETLGVLARETVADDLKSLSQEDRAALRAFGVRFGAFHIFIPLLLKPGATELRLLLWALHGKKVDIHSIPSPPGQGLTSASFDRSTPVGYYGVCGFRICGTRVVRIDMLERLADLIRDRVFWRPRFPEEVRPQGSVEGGGFTIIPDMMSLVGCSGEEFQGILRSLSFRMQKKKVPNPALNSKTVADTSTPATKIEADTTQQLDHDTPDAAERPEPASLLVDEAMTPAPAAALESQIHVVPIAEIDGEVTTLSSTEDAATPQTGSPEAEIIASEIEIDVWWPKDTGPFRHKAGHGNEQRRSRHKGREGVKPQGGEGERPVHGEKSFGQDRHKTARHKKGKAQDKVQAKDRDQASRRAERPVDPDSPFAILQSLKAQLGKAKT